MEWVVVPESLGVLLSAIVELLKSLGVIKEDDGGRWATAGSLIIAFVLTFGVQILELDLGAETPQALIKVAGLIGALIITLVSSFGSHKLFKATKIFPHHR